MSSRLESVRESLWLIGFCIFALFAAVVGGLVLLVVAPFGLVWTGYEHARTAWRHRHLPRPQRRLLRQLRRKLAECERVSRQLDIPSPLDGVLQVQSLQLRNRLVMSAFDVPFNEALVLLGSCRAHGIPRDILQPIWDEGLEEVRIYMDIRELSMLEWRQHNALSGMVPADR